jgi:hypothetical protein
VGRVSVSIERSQRGLGRTSQSPLSVASTHISRRQICTVEFWAICADPSEGDGPGDDGVLYDDEDEEDDVVVLRRPEGMASVCSTKSLRATPLAATHNTNSSWMGPTPFPGG